MQCLLVQLIEQLVHGQFDPGFNAGINAAMFGFDAAATRLQALVFEDFPVLVMALAQGFDLVKILRIDKQADVFSAHRQKLQALAQYLFDLPGIGFQFALDHLASHVLNQADHGFFQLLVLLGKRRQQTAHQTLKAGHPGVQGNLGFLANLELSAVKAFPFTRGKAFVIGLLTDAFELFKGQRLDFVEGHLLHLDRRFLDHLGFNFKRLAPRVKAGQAPYVEGTHILGANHISGNSNAARTSLGGIKRAADIMNFLDSSMESQLMDSIRDIDEDLSGQIEDLMFVFNNLADVDDRGIQALLREVSSDVLVLALKGSDENVQEKIFKNMSKRAAELLRDDLEAKGPVRVSDVETAQKEILTIARRMAEAGEIVLGGKGGEEMI